MLDPRAKRVVAFVFLTVFLDLIGFGIVIPLFPFYVGQMRVVGLGAITSAVGLTTVALAHQAGPPLVGLVLLALGLGVTQPLLSSIASECAGAGQRGAVLGFAQSSGGLARTVGPALSGVLFEALGSGAPFAGGAMVAGLAFVLSLSLRAQSPPA